MTQRLRSLLLIIAICISFCNASRASSIPKTSINPFVNSFFATIDSVRIHYRMWVTDMNPARGKIVLIHGFTGSTFCFRKNCDSLANAGYNVLALDLPAFGYSDRGTWINHSQSSRAILIWKLLDRIDMKDTTKWNILGHSMGAGTAEAVSLLRPSRTRSLILVDAMFFSKNSGVMSAALAPTGIKALNKFYVDFVDHYLLTDKRMSKLLKSGYKRKPDISEVQGYLKPLQTEGTAKAIVSTFANCKELVPLYASNLKGIPVLVIWGSKDSWILPGAASAIKTQVPQMELHKIKGAGHMPMETHPAEFNRILLEFLKKVTG